MDASSRTRRLPPGLVRLFDDFVFRLRRDGIVIAPAQAVVALRATELVGLADPTRLRAAWAACLTTSRVDKERFARAFDAFFALERAPKTRCESRRLVWGPEIDAVVSEVVRSHAARSALVRTYWSGPAEAHDFVSRFQKSPLSQALSRRAPGRLGYLALDAAGQASISMLLGELEARLLTVVGSARASEVLAALTEEMGELTEWFRNEVVAAARARAPSDHSSPSLPALGPYESERIRKALRILAERLLSRERARARRSRRMGVHGPRTLRRALRTMGVPLVMIFRKRPRRRPRLVLVCDISDSVRAYSQLFLEFVSLSHAAFDRTRSFVFVADIAETTSLFRRRATTEAVVEIETGRVVPLNRVTSYARAFERLLAKVGSGLDKKTTLVILGDGRNGFGPPGADLLGSLQKRVGSVIWLCPEARESWSLGDSSMLRYESHCDEVLVVRSEEELTSAVRTVMSRRPSGY